MFLHHLMSVVMLSYTYSAALLPVGQAIMLLMDCSNIFVSLFKMTVDVFKNELLQNAIFGVNIAVWLYLRILVYPTLIYELY